MKVYHILIGGNLGERAQNISLTKALIIKELGAIIAISKCYETAAWGIKNQSNFLNQAFAVSSDLEPEDFLSACLTIENRLGRLRAERWGARTMDIDVLLIGAEVWALPHLEVPHPRLHLRRFALLPLCDIAAEAVHPIYNKTMREILEMCSDTSAAEEQILEPAK